MQTGSHSDTDEYEATENDDDGDDSISIEKVDDNKNATTQATQTSDQSSSTSNQTKLDPRLTKETSFMHLQKFQNLRVALSDVISDNFSFLRNIFPTPPAPDT